MATLSSMSWSTFIVAALVGRACGIVVYALFVDPLVDRYMETRK